MPKLIKPQLSRGPLRRGASGTGSSGTPRKTPISRRSFLQLGAAVGAAAVPRRSPAGLSSQLRFRNNLDSIVIDGPGLTPWSLDKGAFGPHVRYLFDGISSSCNEIKIVGRGEDLPYPVEIVIRFTRQQGRWRVSSSCFGAGSRTPVDAREWLSGEREMEIDDSNFRSAGFFVGDGGVNLKDGPMRAALRNDLSVEFRARGVCAVHFPGAGVMSADIAQLRLIKPELSQIEGTPSSPVLRLSASSGRRRWAGVALNDEMPDPFEMRSAGFLPTSAHVDLSAAEDGPLRVIALNGTADGKFSIGGPLLGPDGSGASLPIGDVSLIHAVNSKETERVMLVSLGEPTGYSFRATGFEATVAASELPSILVVASQIGQDPLHVYLTAKSCALAIPVHDAFIHIVATAANSALKILPAGASSVTPGSAPLIATSTVCECTVEVSGLKATLDLSGVRLSVFRAIDFMAMDFTFQNLLVESSWGTAHLIRGRERFPQPSGTVHPPPPPPGILIAHFQAQAMREQTTYQQDHDTAVIKPANPRDKDVARLSEPTRLAFEIPSSFLDSKPPFSMATLLRWEDFSLRVDERAQSKVPAGFLKSPSLPADDVTSIDFFGLHFSPSERAQWRHHQEPLHIGKRVQLYHGLLFDGQEQDASVGLRAIYRTGYTPNKSVSEHSCALGTGDTPSFSASDQDQTFLVQLMSDYSLVDQASQHNYVPVAMALDYLCLSALGGSMKGHGAFIAPILEKSSSGDDEGIDIESIKHESAFWRLDLEEIKYRYYAFPFAFRISIVKKTARAVYKAESPIDPPLNIACLRTQLFVEWVERSIDFTARPLPFPAAISMPFSSLSIDEKSKTSPPIDNPCLGMPLPYQPKPDPGIAFWPMVNGEPLLLHMIGNDVGGQPGHGTGKASFAAPFIAVKATQALRRDKAKPTADDEVLVAVKKYYRDASFPEIVSRRSVDTHGQYIHYSPVQKPGDSEFKTQNLLFDYDDVPTDPNLAQPMLSHYWPRFVPAVAEGVVTVPAVEHMTGISRVAVSYAPVYLNHGLKNADGSVPVENSGQVTLNLLREAPPPADMSAKTLGADRWIATSKGRTPAEWAKNNFTPPGVGMPFPGGKSGGVMSPGLVMTGFAPPKGPIGGDVDKYAGGVVVNQSFFSGSNEFAAKLVGDILLADVLPPEVREFSDTLQKIPTFLHQAITEIAGELLEPLRTIQTKVDAAEAALQAFTGALTQPMLMLERQADLAVRSTLVDVGNQLQAKLFKDASPYLPAIPAWTNAWAKTRCKLQRADPCPPGAKSMIVPYTAGTACADRCASAQSLEELLTGLVVSLQELQGAEALLQADIQLIIDVFASAAGSSIGWLTDCADRIVTTFRGVAAGDPVGQFAVALIEPLGQFDVGKAIDDLKKVLSQTIDALQGKGSLPSGDQIRSLMDDIEGLLKTATALPDIGALKSLVTAPFDSLLSALTSNFKNAEAAFKELAHTVEVQFTQTIPAQFQGTKQAARDCLKIASDRAKQIILDDLIAKILDVAVPLWTKVMSSDLINGVSAEVAMLISEGSAVVSQLLAFVADAQAVLDELRHPRLIKVDYGFSPDLQDWPADSPIFVAQADGVSAKLSFNVHIEVPFDPVHPEKTVPHIVVDGQLSNFGLVFLPSLEFLRIEFADVSFFSQDGGTPDVKVHVSKVALGSALEFLKAFQSFMQFGGKGNGPYLTLTPQDVRAGYQYFKEEMTIGAFIIRNLGFDAHVELSFEDGPLIGAFSFASESKRFNVCYGVYGGGGYFTIRAAPSYIDSLAIAIEGGVYSDFDCGPIASGTAHALIGFVYSKSRKSCEFRGYFDAAASLEVLDLIHASIHFYLELTYVSTGDSGKTAGVCIVTVDIDLCLWTMHVDVTCYREFSNSGGGKSRLRGLTKPANTPPAVTQVGPGTKGYLEIWNAYEAAFN